MLCDKQGLREGARGTSCTVPVGTGVREDESKHSQFFFNQTQNHWCKPVAGIIINLFVHYSMILITIPISYTRFNEGLRSLGARYQFSYPPVE